MIPNASNNCVVASLLPTMPVSWQVKMCCDRHNSSDDGTSF